MTVTNLHSSGSTKTSRLINAPRATLYRAFTDPDALAIWLSPDGMTGKVHEFDGRVGGGYQMSLYYTAAEPSNTGKSGEWEDRYTARFVELTPPAKIVETINFDTTDPAFAGEMTMIVTLAEQAGGTEVTIVFENLPPGIRPEDNDMGTRSSLEKLARYVGA
jgi:uncharacterized protein YndB with AHSA1/START domain